MGNSVKIRILAHLFTLNILIGTPNYSPVQFMYNSVNFNQLVALYRVADVCLITSTRDGMNLVAYEYIASQKDKNGILILSEFAGAAQSLNGNYKFKNIDCTDLFRSHSD